VGAKGAAVPRRVMSRLLSARIVGSRRAGEEGLVLWRGRAAVGGGRLRAGGGSEAQEGREVQEYLHDGVWLTGGWGAWAGRCM
jgi:hypothetical protein